MWPNRDPILENGGLNLYGYVYNDPLGMLDPYGLYWGDDIPNWIFPVSDYAAGMGDAISFNATRGLRNLFGYGDAVNR